MHVCFVLTFRCVCLPRNFFFSTIHSSFSHFLYASLLHARHLSITHSRCCDKRADDGCQWREKKKKNGAHKFVTFCVIIFVTAQLLCARVYEWVRICCLTNEEELIYANEGKILVRHTGASSENGQGNVYENANRRDKRTKRTQQTVDALMHKSCLSAEHRNDGVCVCVFCNELNYRRKKTQRERETRKRVFQYFFFFCFSVLCAAKTTTTRQHRHSHK